MQDLTTNSKAGTNAGINPKKLVDNNLTESALQQQCVMWFKNNFRPIRKLLYMNHNSGRKSAMAATTDIGLGLTKGVPDLFLALPIKNKLAQLTGDGDQTGTSGFAGLYIEMKTPNGRLSDEQKEMIQLLKEEGYFCEVVNSFKMFQRLILAYLSYSRHAHLLESYHANQNKV